MKAAFQRFDIGFEIAECDAPNGGDQRIKYAMASTHFKSKNVIQRLTPEELLAFTRDLAEMQGYALVEKEPEHWVPLMEGFYVRNLLTNATLAWYPERSIAMNAASEAAEYVYDHMCNLQYFTDEIKQEDFAPLRKQYYLNNPNP